MDLKLYAFQPRGHGEKSFFVVAADEAEARQSVDAEIARLLARGYKDGWRFDSSDYDGWGTDYYEVTVAPRGAVVRNDND